MIKPKKQRKKNPRAIYIREYSSDITQRKTPVIIYPHIFLDIKEKGMKVNLNPN